VPHEIPRRVVTEYPTRAMTDLHRFHWASATLPGSVCGASRPIVLRRSRAVVVSHRWRRSAGWPSWPRVTVEAGWYPPVYGDLNRDGQDEAALVVGCSNGGGTADSFLAYAQVVFMAGGNAPRAIAVLRPQQPTKPNRPPTLLRVAIRPGEVLAREAWYGRHDGTCCPSGRSVTTWKYIDGTLRPVRTVVEKRPR